jgi:hypothetical protein
MTAKRIAIIGHMPAEENFLPLTGKPEADVNLVRTFNYTRVVTEDGKLADHVAYLKRERGVPDNEPFSV